MFMSFFFGYLVNRYPPVAADKLITARTVRAYCFDDEIHVILQMLTDGLWIIVMFLPDSHSDGTHSLQSIHYWDTGTQMLTDGLWIIVMFLPDSHSDGTHSLQSIHCWDTGTQMLTDELE